jgi:hypothetical protein
MGDTHVKAYLAMVVTDNTHVIAKQECQSLREAVTFAYSVPELGNYDLVVYRQGDDKEIAKYGFTTIWGIT